MSGPLIIGGGPAGAAAAINLARSGTRATLIERTIGPTDKVCGDFLSVEAVTELTRLGVDLDALGAATITRLRLIRGRRRAEAVLPFTARGLSRRLLDEALLSRAAEAGAFVRRGALVQSVRADGDHLVWRSGAKEEATRSIFLATGKHDLRGIQRTSGRAGAIGFKTYLRLVPDQAAALADHVELILFRGGYAGLQHVENGASVLCMMVEQPRFVSTGGTWPTLLDAVVEHCPQLRARLDGSQPLRDRPVAIAGVPYGFVHRPASGPDPVPPREGLFRLGDQACVIPSLTGDGIALALHSARLASDTWRQGGSASNYHARFASTLGGQMLIAKALHRLLLGPGAAWATMIGALAPRLLQEAATRTRVRYG